MILPLHREPPSILSLISTMSEPLSILDLAKRNKNLNIIATGLKTYLVAVCLLMLLVNGVSGTQHQRS